MLRIDICVLVIVGIKLLTFDLLMKIAVLFAACVHSCEFLSKQIVRDVQVVPVAFCSYEAVVVAVARKLLGCFGVEKVLTS